MATAELVPLPPAELDELRDALSTTVESARIEAWEHARRAVRTSARAWHALRDSPNARTFPAALVWRLDALEASLNRAIAWKNSQLLAMTAHGGLRLALAARRHFRGGNDLALERLRLDLRELRFSADAGAWQRAERARKRAVSSWQRLREPVTRHALVQSRRLRALPVYYEICFDELERAVRHRQAGRLRRAARSALSLVDTTAVFVGRDISNVE